MFRVKLWPTPYSRYYVLLTVFQTRAAFLRYCRRRGRSMGRYVQGISMARTRQGDYPRGHRNSVTEIVVWRGYLRRRAMTLITHELAHATFTWAAWKGFRSGLAALQPVSGRPGRVGWTMSRESAEERYCYAIGSMATQAVTALYDEGILPT
jgi:hypothetical protein